MSDWISRYVKGVMISMLEAELNNDNLGRLEGWMFGGLESPGDDEKILKIRKEIKRTMKRLAR